MQPSFAGLSSGHEENFYPLPFGTVSAVVEPFENKLVGALDLVLSALGLRVSLLDFFWPLAMMVSPMRSTGRENRHLGKQHNRDHVTDTIMAKAELPWP